MGVHPVWHSLLALHHRIDALLRHCERLEARLDTAMRLTLLQQQVAELKAELEALKAAPRQIVIEKLENRVDTLTVNTLNGILNVGIAHNAALPVDPQLLVSNRPLADLVNPEEGTAPSPHAPIDTPPDGVPPAAPSPNGGKPDAQHETEPDAGKGERADHRGGHHRCQPDPRNGLPEHRAHADRAASSDPHA